MPPSHVEHDKKSQPGHGRDDRHHEARNPRQPEVRPEEAFVCLLELHPLPFLSRVGPDHVHAREVLLNIRGEARQLGLGSQGVLVEAPPELAGYQEEDRKREKAPEREDWIDKPHRKQGERVGDRSIDEVQQPGAEKKPGGAPRRSRRRRPRAVSTTTWPSPARSAGISPRRSAICRPPSPSSPATSP